MKLTILYSLLHFSHCCENNAAIAHLLCVCLSVNLIILVLLAVAFLIIVERNLLNLSEFLYKESPGMFIRFWVYGWTILQCSGTW